jgi:multiple sugar transport system substrate-binding protein
MPRKGGSLLTRRSVLRSGAALGAAAGFGGVSLFNIGRGFAADLPDPAKVLADINVGKYVKADYRKQYGLADDELLWDPKKDWIRTVDWEKVRSEFAGKTVKFAIGAADAESAQDGL